MRGEEADEKQKTDRGDRGLPPISRSVFIWFAGRRLLPGGRFRDTLSTAENGSVLFVVFVVRSVFVVRNEVLVILGEVAQTVAVLFGEILAVD